MSTKNEIQGRIFSFFSGFRTFLETITYVIVAILLDYLKYSLNDSIWIWCIVKN
jgi:hypothetical protein